MDSPELPLNHDDCFESAPEPIVVFEPNGSFKVLNAKTELNLDKVATERIKMDLDENNKPIQHLSTMKYFKIRHINEAFLRSTSSLSINLSTPRNMNKRNPIQRSVSLEVLASQPRFGTPVNEVWERNSDTMVCNQSGIDPVQVSDQNCSTSLDKTSKEASCQTTFENLAPTVSIPTNPKQECTEVTAKTIDIPKKQNSRKPRSWISCILSLWCCFLLISIAIGAIPVFGRKSKK